MQALNSKKFIFMNLDDILIRLKTATEQKSNRAMCLFLGLRDNASGGWIKNGSIPWEACYLAAQKTGFTMEWLLSGEGPQKHGETPPAKVDADRLIEDFKETLVTGVQMGFLKTTDDTTDEALDLLGKALYNRHTGLVHIPAKKDVKKQA